MKTPDPVKAFLQPLCVQCGNCGRRRLFNGGGDVARLNLAEASRRLRCSACGSKTPVLMRAADERDARRWFSDR